MPAVLTSLAPTASAVVPAALFAAGEKPDDSLVSPGIAGFLVTFGLALATWFLIRSMVKHLRKVRYSPEPDEPRQAGPGGSPADGSGRVPPTAPPARGSSAAGGSAQVTKPRPRPEGRDT